MKARLAVMLKKQSNGSYYAVCPELHGCYTQGDTYEKALENLRELAEISIKEELEDGTQIEELYSEESTIYSDMIVEVQR
ncbi:MAG: type II toxin-antitoxin system HicB family antitoxin [Oscillospiraceae bacterium]|nr:type II toxin-antitoxin system HicB family antitoxin [Oscillospiraceae bacterium]